MSVRPIAQQDPVPNLTARWGQTAHQTQRQVEHLTDWLRQLDKERDQLAEHDVSVDVDLGPVGNAARAARRDLERDTGKPTFTFPKPR